MLIDTARGEQSTITVSGLVVRAKHLADLEARVGRWLGRCRVLMLGGSVPPGVPADWYGQWIRRGRALGLPVLLDTSGETLARCAPAGPTVVKPNLDELAELAGRPLSSRADAVQAARELLNWGIDLVVATLGADGAVAITGKETIYLPPLPVRPVNCAGAGDAMMAGLACAYARGWPMEQGLRLAVAAATAVVITPGTAECRREDVERFLPQVRLEPWG